MTTCDGNTAALNNYLAEQDAYDRYDEGLQEYAERIQENFCMSEIFDAMDEIPQAEFLAKLNGDDPKKFHDLIKKAVSDYAMKLAEKEYEPEPPMTLSERRQMAKAIEMGVD